MKRLDEIQHLVAELQQFRRLYKDPTFGANESLFGWVSDILNAVSEEITLNNDVKMKNIYDSLWLFLAVFETRYEMHHQQIEKNALTEDEINGALNELENFEMDLNEFVERNTDSDSHYRCWDFFPYVLDGVSYGISLNEDVKAGLLECIRRMPEIEDAEVQEYE